jgi:hypothetical protein
MLEFSPWLRLCALYIVLWKKKNLVLS